ncbi:MAG: hypothetical protein JOY58_07925 [Solirubrobacterales bacterium]|nr:hypothetical protein [Solirubrobacterales bacterium]
MPEAGPLVEGAALVPPAAAVDGLALVAALVLAPAPGACEPAGTVKVGAPAVLVVADPELPQAETASAVPAPIASTARILIAASRALTGSTSGPEWVHAPTANRTVVQILLRQLIAPGAEAQVVHRPWKLGRCRRQRQQLGDHLQLLARVTIDVRRVGIGLDDHLATGRWRPETVLLANPHSSGILPGRPDE